jgi:hypothetical protein
MRAAVLQHCKGLLDISYQLQSKQHAQQFAVWLAQCGQLAGSLRCWLAEAPVRRLHADGRTEAELFSMLESAEQVVAAALVQLHEEHQHGQQHGLQLHTLVWHRIGSSSAAVDLLQVLPAEKVLRLGIWQEEPVGSVDWEPQHSANISASSIAALTKLQSLSLKAAVDVQQLLPALTALTNLCVSSAGSNRFSKEQFATLQQRLPAQLKGLTLEVEMERHVQTPPLQLSHLSCITALNTVQIQEGSQLPPQLLQLQCRNCKSMQPLLGCRQLQHVELYCSTAAADELSQLSRLTSLTHLSLSYAEHMFTGMADAAAPAWPLVAGALKELSINGLDPGGISSNTFQQLKHLHSLTRLHIHVIDDHEGDAAVALPVTPVQCSEVLAGLTSLRTLELSMDPGRHLLLHEQAAQHDQQGAAAAAAGPAAAAAPEGAAPAAAAAGVQFNGVWPPAAAAAAAAAADANVAMPAMGGLAQALGGQAQVFQMHMEALTAQAAMLLAQLQAAAAAAGVQFNVVLPQALGTLLAQLQAAAAEAVAHPAAAAAQAAAAPAAAGDVAAAAALQAAGGAAAEPAGGVQADAVEMLQAAAPLAPLGQALLQQIQQVMPPQQQQLLLPAMPQMQLNASPNMLPVTRVIEQLPHLDSLELKGSGLSLETVDPLTSLTRLTRLTMSGVDFDEAAFNSLALGLTGLQRLSIGGSELVGDAALVVVARALRKLTELNVRNCSRVTNRGVLQLTALQNLKVLLVEDTAVSQQVVARVLRCSAMQPGAAA